MKDFVVIYHGNCVDGFTAAWIAHQIFGETADYLPYKYGDDPPEFHGNEKVYILDFSFSKDILIKMRGEVTALHVLDHHKSAEKELRGLTDCGFGGLTYSIHFDMDKCGARLTWEFFRQDEDVSELVRYVEDRDLWKLNSSREISAAIQSYDFTWKNWDQLRYWLNKPTLKTGLISQGEAILRYQEQSIKKHLSQVVTGYIGGHDVPVVNCTDKSIVSELCHQMSEGHPFAGAYENKGDMFTWSLRSQGDGLDVAEVAKKFGGGGHKHAAGFREEEWGE